MLNTSLSNVLDRGPQGSTKKIIHAVFGSDFYVEFSLVKPALDQPIKDKKK